MGNLGIQLAESFAFLGCETKENVVELGEEVTGDVDGHGERIEIKG